MTEKELAKKAFEYRKELVPYTELGYPDVAIPVYEALDIDRAYVAGAKEMQKENEELKQQVSYLEDNLRVARKDREDLRDSVANGLEEFIKEKPHTSLVLLANKEIKEENEQLKAQIEKMKCCPNCKYGEQGYPDYNRECYFCDVDRCICAVTGNKMTWDEKCDKWELAE